MRKRLTIILPVLLILTLMTTLLLVETVPPRERTIADMKATQRRILDFARAKDRLPSSLPELPAVSGYDDNPDDAWESPFDYETDTATGTVTLRSLGGDQAPGGTGIHADITLTFPSRNAQGQWADAGEGTAK
ncbi:MAG: type II secretion system protein GspG [Prosthecobacter sp.]|nr:type II secretion system protein GspG [Prosthecobacter sp.]